MVSASGELTEDAFEGAVLDLLAEAHQAPSMLRTSAMPDVCSLPSARAWQGFHHQHGGAGKAEQLQDGNEMDLLEPHLGMSLGTFPSWLVRELSFTAETAHLHAGMHGLTLSHAQL